MLQKGSLLEQVFKKAARRGSRHSSGWQTWCSHHQTNTHSSEECWHLHPHLKYQGGGRQKGKGKQSNARSAEAANSGGSGTPSGAQLQKMFATFMLTLNAASGGPRREDLYSGSVV
jgi:hypothetical protein